MKFFRILFFGVIILLVAGGAMYLIQINGEFWPQIGMLISQWHADDLNSQQNREAPKQRTMSLFNNQAALNKEKLNQAVTILNRTMELITTDPYSQITVLDKTRELHHESDKSVVTVIPKEGTTVYVNPNPSGKTDLSGGVSVVYNQGKLEQLHNGIFKFSQAGFLLQELNNDLAEQALMKETDPVNQQTYAVRYNLTLQNQNKINQANRLLQEAMILVNVNPYAPNDGYVYNTQKMQQLHNGITELAKSTLLLNELSQDFSQQMLQWLAESRTLGGNQDKQPQQPKAERTDNNFPGILHFVIIIILLGAIATVLLFIKRCFRGNRISQ